MRLTTLLALTAMLIGCQQQRSIATQHSAPEIAAGSGRAMTARRHTVAADGDDAGVSVVRTDYNAIAEEACRASGGECVARNDCGPDVGARLPTVCRPGSAGLTCCRKPASDCPGYETASCCRMAEGRLTNSSAYCDRGYPSCVGFPDEYHLASDLACKVPLEEAAKDAPNRWPGTIGAREAGQRACSQAGGRAVSTPGQCDGYLIALATEPCCIPRSLCPEQNAGTECCQRDGALHPKECTSGAAVCPPGPLGFGTMREVPAGTCQPF